MRPASSYQVLYSFGGPPDGGFPGNPCSPLVWHPELLPLNVVPRGGCSRRVTPRDSPQHYGKAKGHLLYSFGVGTGRYPDADLIDASGRLYGTARSRLANHCLLDRLRPFGASLKARLVVLGVDHGYE